jgi:energy-coupling factor transporter ATP-binding protein EcfA2
LLSELNQDEKFKDKFLLWLPYDEYGGIDEIDPNSDEWIKSNYIRTTDILGSSRQKQIDFFLWKSDLKTDGTAKFTQDQFRGWFLRKKACIKGSDSHSQDYPIGKLKDKDSKPIEKYCWIKAEPTFEGLKQIVYEPETRIFIGEEKPKKPINTIDSITLKIPDDAKVDEDKFCFAGNNSTYNLSPYFNCFIGGRGSGKSTILDFLGLHSNNPDSPKKFWDNLSPSFDPNEKSNFNFSGTEIFEFLAQSEIETFARDKSKFTQAIYDRANSHAGNILEEYEEAIESLKGKLGQIIQAVSDLKNLEDQKVGKEKEKRTLESSVKVLSSKEYNEVITGITNKSKELQKLEDWKENISDLKNSLSELIPESESEEPKEKVEKTEYEKAYDLAITKIAEAVELLKEEKFTEETKKESEIKKALVDLENKAKALIEKAGYTPESVEQIKSAPQKITNLESEIKNLTTQIEAKAKVIATLESVVNGLNTNKQNYETKITEILKPLQDLLKKQFEDNQGKDIKQISLEYSFNEKGAWVTLAEEFYNHFFSKYHDTERGKEVCEFITGNEQTFSKNSFDDVRKIIQQSQKNDKKYTKFLDEVFKEEKNFQIFQAIRGKHLYDVKLNKIIQVKYDNRDVEQASFGQRCTAVVVILLLFGNYPLIIDEPEAHLDSSLIANYLVPLLKEKKSDRQIIFATHNANFVINGDAEKIFILKNESGQTEVIETTIEDTKNREELLKLEGGKEAFEKRGEKLNIK